MKKPTLLLMASLASFCVSAFGQGTLMFNNRVLGVVDARVTLVGTVQGMTDDMPEIGYRWAAQLFGGPEGGALVALTPITTFKTGNDAGYVVPVNVTLPNVVPGAKASLQMKVFAIENFGFSASKVFTVTTGGGAFPPADLAGLEAFSVLIPPEPSSIVLGIVGALGLFIVRRRR